MDVPIATEEQEWGQGNAGLRGDASTGPLLSGPPKVMQGKRKGAARGDMQEGGFQF